MTVQKSVGYRVQFPPADAAPLVPQGPLRGDGRGVLRLRLAKGQHGLGERLFLRQRRRRHVLPLGEWSQGTYEAICLTL